MSQTHRGSIFSADFLVVYFLMADAESAPLPSALPLCRRVLCSKLASRNSVPQLICDLAHLYLSWPAATTLLHSRF